MPETDGMEAWQATERARAAMSEAPFPEVGRVTVSGGVCDLERADGPEELYRQADVALYWAKRNGRDVVFLYTPEAMEALGEEERAAELRRNQAFQSIRVLARAGGRQGPLHAAPLGARRRAGRVPGPDAGLGRRAHRPAGRGGAGPRRGQDRRLRLDPLQARGPHRGRDGQGEPALRAGRRDALGRAHARAGLVGARPPRALGRPGVSGRAGGRGDARGGPHPAPGRRLGRDDQQPSLRGADDPRGRPRRVPPPGRRASSGRPRSPPSRSSPSRAGSPGPRSRTPPCWSASRRCGPARRRGCGGAPGCARRPWPGRACGRPAAPAPRASRRPPARRRRPRR